MLKRTALVEDSIAGRQAQCMATWVVKQLLAGNEVQCLFTATEYLVLKQSSNLI